MTVNGYEDNFIYPHFIIQSQCVMTRIVWTCRGISHIQRARLPSSTSDSGTLNTAEALSKPPVCAISSPLPVWIRTTLNGHFHSHRSVPLTPHVSAGDPLWGSARFHRIKMTRTMNSLIHQGPPPRVRPCLPSFTVHVHCLSQHNYKWTESQHRGPWQ